MADFLTHPITALHLPANEVNPYNRLLAEALAPFGVNCVPWVLPPRGRNPRRLLPRLRSADLVHWHWTQGLYPGRNAVTFALRSLLFASVLYELRLRRIPQVATIHNLLPHEHSYPSLHRAMFRIIGALVDRIQVHHIDAMDAVAALYGHREKMRVIPLIDYGDSAATAPRNELRKKWGLESYPHWAISFGPVRRYKRIDQLLRAAEALAGQGIGLLIAGLCLDTAYLAELQRQPKSGAVRLILRSLEDPELSELLFASDAALMTYRSESLTSSAAHLAFSHGLPVVATDALAFREMIRRGLVAPCHPEDTDDLVAAVTRAIQMRATEEWLSAVQAYRHDCSASVVGSQWAALYAELSPSP